MFLRRTSPQWNKIVSRQQPENGAFAQFFIVAAQSAKHFTLAADLYNLRRMKAFKYLLLVLLSFCAPRLVASPQLPDFLIYEKDTFPTYNLLLEAYLEQQEAEHKGYLFELAFRNNASMNCWRGYQAFYEIMHDSLFLVAVTDCEAWRTGGTSKSASNEKMKAIFGDKFENGKVFIHWFTGRLSFPINNRVLRWDGVFYQIFEQEKLFTVSNGLITRIEDIKNYAKVHGGIDRRNKHKLPYILFKELKKVKWEKSLELDCSLEYLVTIDEGGRISKVTLLQEYDETATQEEKDESQWCVNKVFNALKHLKFNILKDKGRPISEEVLLDIWITDEGKIENHME